MNPTIAFLGIGLMGAPMVRRLLRAGLEVRIWNRSRAKAEHLAEDGGILATDPVQAVLGADIVCLCLTDGEAVEAVLFGEYGVAQALDDDTLVIDFSTIGPASTLELSQRLTNMGAAAHWIDAPVTGGVKGAESGELVILCGGVSGDVERAMTVLRPLSRRVCHMGPLGSGQAAKMCNQLIVTVNVVAIAEALALGREFGLDLAALPDALQGGWADSAPLQIIGKRMAQEISEPPIVVVGTFAKDLQLALANASGSLPLAYRADTIFQDAIIQGFGQKDASVLLRFVEQRQTD